MANKRSESANGSKRTLPALPLADEHRLAIFEVLGLSPRQITIVELMLRDAGNREITTLLGISEGTLKTQQRRIFSRTGTRSRMQLAMRVLTVSHEVMGNGRCRPIG
jgi:DNA-binding NarL/FixJ family response regulator